MSDNHFVRVDINGAPEGEVTWSIYCTAPEGSPCRLWCSEGCEEADDEHDQKHELSDQGHCVQTTGWFDDTRLVPEMYDGGLQPLRSDAIHIEYQGGYSTWHYAKEVEDYRD